MLHLVQQIKDYQNDQILYHVHDMANSFRRKISRLLFQKRPCVLRLNLGVLRFRVSHVFVAGKMVDKPVKDPGRRIVTLLQDHAL